MRSIYWDAAVFHALFSKEEGRHEVCADIFKQAQNNNLIIYTSALTMVECLWLKGLPKISQEHEEKIQKFFEHHYIRIMNCDRPLGESARSLVWKYSIHPKDAIHVASGLFLAVDAFHTYDDGLLKFNGKLGSPPLKIIVPSNNASDGAFDLKS